MITPYDVIIVLGYDVSSKGYMPKESKNRVIKAKQLFEAKEADKILFTGRLSLVHHFRPKRTESQTMFDYGLSLGIPGSVIMIENRSRSTLKNAQYTKLILDNHRWKKFVVITGSFHLKRARYIFSKVYDNNYSYKFVSSENGLSSKQLSRQKKIEKLKWLKPLIIRRVK